MSLATSMKNLVEDIRSSIQDRHVFLKDSRALVRDLLARFGIERQDLIKELKEMAREVKNFLDNNEKVRKEDFAAVMENVNTRLDEIRQQQKDIRQESQELIKEYTADREKAGEYWRSLHTAGSSKKEEVDEVEKKAKKKKK